MKEKTSLLIKGLTQEQKDFLYQYAKDKLGSRSRTQAVIHLIKEKMEDYEPKKPKYERGERSINRKRLQLSLLQTDYDNLEAAAEETDSSMQHYLIRLLVKDLYDEKILTGKQYELLRKSNYQLHKIGVNVNQIAKAINEGEQRKLEIERLAKYIESHVDIIKNILNNSYNKH